MLLELDGGKSEMEDDSLWWPRKRTNKKNSICVVNFFVCVKVQNIK